MYLNMPVMYVCDCMKGHFHVTVSISFCKCPDKKVALQVLSG